MTKYISYCRKSTESDDRQAMSIDSQIEEIRRRAIRDGVNLDKEFTESKSAKAPGRLVFDEMMKYIEKHGSCIIYVWKLDRLARNGVDGGLLIYYMDKGYIKEIRNFEKVFTNTSDDKFFMTLDFGIAKKYVDDLSTNVKRGIRTKIEKGGWPTRAPFGYLNDKAKKAIYPDPERSQFVAEMFNLYSLGSNSLQDITDTMYEKGLRTLKGYKVHKGTLYRVLTNPVHAGFIEKDGKYFIGNHPSIISKETFDRVQEVINGKNKSRKQLHDFTYRGFINCHVCGCSLTAALKKGLYTYYYCTNGKGNCEQHKKYLRSNEVDNYVAGILDKIGFDEEMIEIMYLASKEKLKYNNQYSESAIDGLKKQLTSAREKQSRLADSYLSGFTPEDVYNAKIKDIGNEIVATEAQLFRLENSSAQDETTLELTKKVFLTASRAKKEFLDKNNFNKRRVLEKLLWNLTIENQNLATYKLKEPYQMMTRTLLNAPIFDLSG